MPPARPADSPATTLLTPTMSIDHASRPLVAALAITLAPLAPLAAQEPALRDPALPYGSWGEAARETAAAIAARPLARPADGRWQVGDAVIFDDDGKRYRAHVTGFDQGRVQLRHDGFGPEARRLVPPERLLGYQPGFTPAARPAGSAAAAAGAAGGPAVGAPVGAGKYGCTESQFRYNQGYEFQFRGSFTLAADGTYEYTGMRTRGRWRWDAAAGAVRFTGGFFDGARAVRLEDSPKLRLELPTGDPNRPRRWSCGPV